MVYTNKLFQIVFAADGVCFGHCGITFGNTMTKPWLRSTVVVAVRIVSQKQ